MRDRPNPKGLTRDQDESQIFKLGDGRYRLFSVNPTDSAPTREELGEVTKDWSAVHVIWSSDRYTSTDIIYARVRPWRYFATGPKPVAAATREGLWIPDMEIEVALTVGAVTRTRASHYVWETRGAEKMFWQVIEIVNENDGTDLTWTQEQAYGYVRRAEDAHAVVVNSPNAGDGGGGGPIQVEIEDQVVAQGREDTVYSNAFGDFVVTRSDSDTLVLHDLPIPIDGSMILGIVVKTPGAVNETTERYRGAGLQCQYTPATGVLDVGGALSFAVGDDIIVYIEGPPKSIEEGPNGLMYRRTKNVNPDSKLVTEDGGFTVTLAEAAPTEYFTLNMGEDGLHFLSLQHNITSDAIVTIEGTNDLNRDGQEVWDDITVQMTGYTQLDSTVPDNVPTVSWCGYRRIRLALAPGDSGGTVNMYLMRSATGTVWNPVAHSDFTAVTSGPQIMELARSTQPTAVDSGDAVRATSNIYGERVLANYIWATQANRTEEDDPIDTRDVGDTLADVTDGADDTYYYYADMAHYRKFGLEAILSGGSGTVTLTVEGTLQDDGTAPASCTYDDITQYGMDSMTSANAASYTASCILQTNEASQAYKYIRIKIVAATGDADDADWTLYGRRLY